MIFSILALSIYFNSYQKFSSIAKIYHNQFLINGDNKIKFSKNKLKLIEKSRLVD